MRARGRRRAETVGPTRLHAARIDNSLTAAQICSIICSHKPNSRRARVRPPLRPENRCDRAPAARDRGASVRSGRPRPSGSGGWSRGSEGGVAIAEIARREGISERGMRKYVKNLFGRRAPEATGEFIATQMNRLNEALLVSYDAMSPENLPAVDRVVRIVRELDRYQGFCGGGGEPQRAASFWKASIPEPKQAPAPPGPRSISRGPRLLPKTSLRKTICATRWRTSFPIRPLSPTVCREARVKGTPKPAPQHRRHRERPRVEEPGGWRSRGRWAERSTFALASRPDGRGCGPWIASLRSQ